MSLGLWFLIALFGVIVWRVVLPSLKLEQGNIRNPQQQSPEMKKWAKEHALSIAIAIVGVVLAILAFLSPAQPAEIGGFSWKYVLAILVIWMTLASLVALNADKETNKTLQKILGGTLVVVLIAMPVIGEVQDSLKPKPAVTERATRSEPAFPQSKNPLHTWSVVTLSAKARSELIPVPPGWHVDTTLEEFELHTVYFNGRDCESTQKCPEDHIKGVYFLNTSDRTITISYAYAPRG